jgi:geranylgeranyl pyrophosphate synthase
LAGPIDARFAADVRGRLAELDNPVVRETLAAQPDLFRAHLVEVCARPGAHDRARTVRLAALVELLHVHHRSGHPAVYALAAREAADLGRAASEAFHVAAAEVAAGELEAVEGTLGVAEHVSMAKRKTGALFRLACVFGAYSADTDLTAVDAVAVFGDEFGVAVQVAAEVRDFRSDTTTARHGLPTLCALRNGADYLRELLLDPDPDMATVRTLVASAGGLATAMGMARTHQRNAVTALTPVADTDTGRALAATAEAVGRTWTR